MHFGLISTSFTRILFQAELELQFMQAVHTNKSYSSEYENFFFFKIQKLNKKENEKKMDACSFFLQNLNDFVPLLFC